ncbi:putative checkpoint protein kinase protein [Neofusicoccum parvum]|uniref:Checkpoint protein kinase protein n=1 Tax=Neofusicoccum parvum TaxID=310453 RepID=A0ACB5SAL1_9PEZI|nr:putative checkpoint protein kinase protein [Neofusicoccum parvum]
MAADDLINFDDIEPHKENIQRVQGGRSAKALAAVLSPKNADNALKPVPSDQEKINNVKRQEFEKELEAIDESDDPLDIYDRYVKWTFDTYPNPASQQSQLLPLLEKATKAFLKSPHYKNDPRYLKLWLHYIKLFSDEPRQTFAFLARHSIGDVLALFYEEFAAYLETQGRWNQAEEVYSMGVDKEARPTERLLRKYGEFQQRMEAREQDTNGPSSPALPVVRAALADKADPFGSVTSSPNPQSGSSGSSSKKKAKMAIFADSDEPKQSVLGGTARKGETVQTMAERKKENTQEAQAWSGQKLNGGKRNVGVEKLMIFKDKSIPESLSSENSSMREAQQTVNPRTGKIERVFVNLEAVYPNADDPMAAEFCFEELRATHRGWMKYDWAVINRQEAEKRKQERAKKEIQERKVLKPKDPQSPMKDPAATLAKGLKQSLVLNDVNDENAPPSQEEIQRAKMLKKQRKEERANRTRKIKVTEVHNETQTIRANLGSPTGPKIKRKKTAEPTMTINTKEAMEEIYGIFNQPLKSTKEESGEEESEEESDDDDNYTSGGESTCTGRISGTTSEYGDETTQGDFTVKSAMDDDDTNASRASEWSEFTESKHIPRDDDDSQASDSCDEDDEATGRSSVNVHEDEGYGGSQDPEDLHTPTSPEFKPAALPTRYVPVPPEDVEVPRRTYRDQVQMANNRLPFMTPIAEKTESSLGAATVLAEQKDYFNSKTPSRQSGGKTPVILEDQTEDLSGSFKDILEEALRENGGKMAQPALSKPKESKPKPAPLGTSKAIAPQEIKDTLPKGPIIQDKQCNPVDEQVRQTILENIHPPLASYDGYHAELDRSYGRHGEIKKFTKAAAKAKNGGDKTGNNFVPPTLNFDNGDREYVIKRQLGEGAFAPVYLAEGKEIDSGADDEEGPAQMGRGAFGSVTRKPLEAIKMEDPPSAWEFYILRQAHRRLGVSRAAGSIIHAHEMRMFRDECYLVLEYRDQGTLLDLVNIARAELTPTGGAGVMDEQLAMFFTIELLRTVEALHSKGIIHGDLKADNVLARLETSVPDNQWSSQYRADGSGGWSAKGIALIDLGRGIDLRAFRPDVQFVADWKTSEADCAEMREMRPWTFQVDYHGLAATVHSLLFGKYIETVAERGAVLGAGAPKTYRVREPLKRYWQTELWGECFDLLLNPLKHLEGEEGQRLPALRGMRRETAILMGDFTSDIAVKHAFPGEFVIRHTLDISPSVASIAKDIRNVVISAVVAWSIVSLVSTITHRRNPSS